MTLYHAGTSHNAAERSFSAPLPQARQIPIAHMPPGAAGTTQPSTVPPANVAAAQAAAAQAAAWAAATNYGYVWNSPQFAVPTSMQVFVPAVQYAGQQLPDFSAGSQVR